MSCPTCDHTMEAIGDHAAQKMFLCPRCGTFKVLTYIGAPKWHEEVMVPKLVERCREFRKVLAGSRPILNAWHTIGVREAINTPEQRPTVFE